MRLSCLPVSLSADLTAGRRTLADWFRLAGTLGLDGADVSVLHVSSQRSPDLDALRQQAVDAGIQIAILAAYPDFIHPDPRERARQVDAMRRWIEVAQRLDATAVRVTAGRDRPRIDESDALGWAAEGLAACAAAASGTKLRVLYENHGRGAAWGRNDFTQPAARFLEVVRRTRGTGLDVLFDTANNLALDEDPAAVLDAVLDRLGAVHISDIRRRGTFEPTVIGTGVAPIAQLLSRIVSSGFNGWVSVEEASGMGESAILPSLQFADRAWIEAGGRPRVSTR